MFDRILVANRGEVALRVIRAAKEMGIESVAVYSEADKDSLPVAMADHAVCIGPAQSALSYLNMPNIISAALQTGAAGDSPRLWLPRRERRFRARVRGLRNRLHRPVAGRHRAHGRQVGRARDHGRRRRAHGARQ